MINVLHPTVQQFIRDHENDDVKQLVLKFKHVEGVPIAVIADQINGRRKAIGKLPTFYANQNIFYPPGLNLEQSSSEKTAQYKSEFISRELSLKKLGVIADLTGGFGVDSFYLSKIANRVLYLEPNQQLFEIVKHNHASLRALNIDHQNTSAEEFLQQHSHPLDLVYIDPSRRVKGNQKVFKLSDCEPDVAALQPSIFEKTNHLLVKTSPLLDLHQGLKELQGTKKILILAAENECKEVLFLCEKNFLGEPEIIAVNLQANKVDTFSFLLQEERETKAIFSDPLTYLYEPNAAILKAGAFKTLAARTGLSKLHVNTHLYTSRELMKDFPGRVFNLETSLKSEPKEIAKHFPEGKANVFTRNYPLSVEELKKKLKLKDGGDRYLAAFTGEHGKFLFVANRLVL